MRQCVPLLVPSAILAGCVPTDLDGDGVVAMMDCNDQDPDQGLPVELYIDNDGDGYGGSERSLGCPGNAWLVADASDCDDFDAGVHPDTAEIGCDGRDNDCDAATADGPAVTVGATWATVQQAIDVAGYGETVSLCASTIDESIVIDRQIVLRGAGAEHTVLDGGGRPTPTVLIVGPATVLDLTVTGGAGLVGGGIRVASGRERVVLDGLIVRDNVAEEGGGIAAESPLVVYDSEIRDNRATLGAGVLARGAELDLVRSRIHGNVAEHGGGLWLQGQAWLDTTAIDDNLATQGGGVWLEGDLLGSNATIGENRATRGGGVYGSGSLTAVAVTDNASDEAGGIWASAALVLEEVDLTRNTATVGDGGGMVAAAPVRATGGSIRDNLATSAGGGVRADAPVLLGALRVQDNLAARGGGVSLGPGAALSASAVDLVDNEATEAGGGLSTTCGALDSRVRGGQLSGNRAPSGAFAAVHDAELLVRGVEIVANIAEPEGAAFEVLGSCATARLEVDDAAWVDNEPADLLVGDLPAQAAPTSGFTCVSSSLVQGCSTP